MIRFLKDDLSECIEYCREKTVLGVDTETTGFDCHSNSVIMFQIGDKDKQFVIDTRFCDISPLEEILHSRDIIKIFHNASFDWKHIYSSFKIDTRGIYDTFLVEKILFNGIEDRPKGLKDLVSRYLDINMPKEARGTFNSMGGSEAFSEEQISYGAKDIKYLEHLRDKQIEISKEKDLDPVITLENQFVRVKSIMEYNGFYLDKDKWMEVVNKNKEKLHESMKKMEDWIIKNGPEDYIDRNPTLFEEGPFAKTLIKRGKKSVYLFSSQKETVKFFNDIGIDTKVEDEKGGLKDSVEESHIRKFKDQCSFVDLYLDFKEYEKAVTTYGEDFLSYINKVTGRVHSEFNQIQHTGRMSSREPNLQNIPSGEEYRSCFTNQYEDTILCVSDFSRQEPSITADKSKDPVLLDFYNNGSGDAHSLVASIISEVTEGERIEVSKSNNPVSKKLGIPIRDIGKVVGLSLDYGASAYSLSSNLECSQQEAQKIIDKVNSELSGKTEMFNKNIDFIINNGYITMNPYTKRKFFVNDFDKFKELEEEFTQQFWQQYKSEKNKGSDKFKYELKPLVKKYFKWKGSLQRAAQNYCIQGTAADMTKYAMILIQEEFDRQDLEAWIVNQVHDEIVVETKRDISKKIKEILESCMKKAGSFFCRDVPMELETEITTKWEH